jgi:hypothetical protein
MDLDRDTGSLRFPLTRSGHKVKVCVEYYVTDRATVERYEFDVTTGERPRVGLSAFPKQVVEAHETLSRARASVISTTKGIPAVCPKLSGSVYTYEVDWLEQLHAAPTVEATALFAPPSPTQNLLHFPETYTGSRRDAEYLDKTHALLITTTALVMPKYLGARYVPGEYTGEVSVVELAGARVLCRFPLAFRSSSEVSVRHKKGESVDEAHAEYQVAADFSREGAASLATSLKKAAPELVIRWY